MIEPFIDVGVRNLGTAPLHAGDRRRHFRSTTPRVLDEIVGQQTREDKRPTEPFCLTHVTSRIDKRCELGIRHRKAVESQGADGDSSFGTLAVAGITELPHRYPW